MGLLTGIRVLAVELYGAGPFGTQALADLGAEIIKIENPREGGDVTRSLGPYFDAAMGETAESLFFQSINRNKRSVALDLATSEGHAAFLALARGADAVACNLRGDVPAKLGITYETLAAVNPKIVCAFLTAYGREGSRASWPGYDYMIQAEAGYFALNGEPDSPPSRFGLSIVDFMTGYCMALSLLAGIMAARESGTGRNIDVALYDVGLANLNYLAAWSANAGYEPARIARSGHPTLVPCQLFRTKDSWIYIMANKEKFFPALCAALNRPELIADARFTGFAERLAHRAELSDLLDDAFGTRTTADWLETLAGVVPAAPVMKMGEALKSRFTEERNMVVEVETADGARVKVVGSPFRTGETDPCRAAPVLGQDTEALLLAAGYGSPQIEAMRRRGIVI
ncbi:CaiB/BaiF CoA transferase family protein [Phaeovulum sp.]|uniref:CaiB/BaiF CoA transferase family protein n=1 Tax=Phaeovulum sp. TaxID=2934796 RepID=UPI00272FB854|nr:CoA transferase [Phaeovulum sp.]MDP1670099.1 CoA transferase [Phaeovulum sp.]MDZ4118341.1 CoA transferase [Phaeovulum sp.]